MPVALSGHSCCTWIVDPFAVVGTGLDVLRPKKKEDDGDGDPERDVDIDVDDEERRSRSSSDFMETRWRV